MKTLIILLSFISIAQAGLHQAPPAFKTDFGRAIFVDFIRANYNLRYDYYNGSATAETTIVFNATDTGLPIFDSVHDPLEISIDGIDTRQELVSVPGDVSQVRVATQAVTPGIHTLKIKTEIKSGVKYGWKGVSSGFFIKDLSDRNFLEKYVPSNYEYDQYQMNFHVEIVGTSRSHNIIANGEVKEISKNVIEVSYPEFYTSSSVFFHLMPKTKFWRLYFTYTSISGRRFPVTIYSHFRFTNWLYKRKMLKVMRELEADYGPWPHPSLIIYGTKLTGGMEYVGATASSLISLGHEMQHSYFAKGILPANGNSGWMDEAIASWRDKGHQSHQTPNYSSVNLAKHNDYTRKTDDRSYEKGRSFIAYLDYQFKALGLSMKDFLRGYFIKRKFTTVTTEDFITDLEEYSGLDLREDFNQYIFGGYSEVENLGRAPAVEPENPHHVPYTDEEIYSIL